jgi:vacuolar-type H+-ATPase subunit H
MATEPTGSMPERMESKGSSTEAPSNPTGDHAEGVAAGAQEQVRAVAGTAGDEAKELARQAGDQARQVAQEAKHELRTLTEQGRQQLRGQAEAQTHRASQNLRTLSDQTRALAEGRPDEAGPLVGYVQDVSGRLSGWADNLDRRGFDGMVAQVQGFARRRPAAFIGLCAVAGFAVSRVGRTVRSESREESVGTQPMLPPAATGAGSTSGPTTDAPAAGSSPSSSSGGSEPVLLPQVEAASERARGGR